MRKITVRTVPFYYETNDAGTVLGDSFRVLQRIRPESVDMIFADPPYFLGNNGITCQGRKMISVNKGSWDKSESENGRSIEEKHKPDRRWIKLCKRVLKPDGAVWVSGTLHNIYSIGVALEQGGFKIINNITWQKTDSPPNLACRRLTHSIGTILWTRKDEKKYRHFFDYSRMREMNGGRQMKNIWVGSLTKPNEESEGKHPTRKPGYLLGRIILTSTEEGQAVLDPFCGSGITGLVALKRNRKFIGIDNVEEYL